VRRYGRVTLVEVVVENDGRWPRTVRITSELDGPVWPPRTRGVPETEFDEGTISTRVGPGERRSFGFASPAEPVEPPVSVTSETAATDGGDPTPADVVRVLGDPRPPRDAVPDPGNLVGGPDAAGRTNRDRGTDAVDRSCPSTDRDERTGSDRRDRAAPAGTREGDEGVRRRHEPGPPPAVGAWLAAVERCIDDGRAGSVPDPRVLRAVADRAGSLADRLETAGDAGANPPDREDEADRDGGNRP